MVRAKTPKLCGHYRYFILVITITELRYATLTVYEYKETFPLTYKKKRV